jgi:DNA-binding MarR family transcriptional regulator
MLKKMESSGWVRRRRSEEDERSVQIFLTEEGRAMKQKVSDVPRQVGSCFCLNAEDAQKLYELLYQILTPECRAE